MIPLAYTDVFWQTMPAILGAIVGPVGVLVLGVYIKHSTDNTSLAIAKLNADQQLRADALRLQFDASEAERKHQADNVALKAKEAAVKVADVKAHLETTTRDTDRKLDGLAKVAAATHVLVNSAMATQLRLNATLTRRLADITKDQCDIDAADLAAKMYHDHQGKQKIVDEQPGSDASKQGKAEPIEVVIVNPPDHPANVQEIEPPKPN